MNMQTRLDRTSLSETDFLAVQPLDALAHLHPPPALRLWWTRSCLFWHLVRGCLYPSVASTWSLYNTFPIYNQGSGFILPSFVEGLRWILLYECVCSLKKNDFLIHHEYCCSFVIDLGHLGPSSPLRNLSWKSDPFSSEPTPGWRGQVLLILWWWLDSSF